MTKIAILDDYLDIARSMAEWGRLPTDCEITVFRDTLKDEAALAERLAPFDVLCAMRERTPFPASLLEKLTNLKLMVTSGMRNKAIDLEAAAARGVTVCGTESPAIATVELTWGLILACMRHIPAEDRDMRSGGWQKKLGRDLAGKTLGVVGLGRLGAKVAKIGQAFDMDVIAWSQNLSAEAAAEKGVRRVEKEALFREADVVTIHLVLSERSRGLVSSAELAMMKSSAVLINCARGPICDERALIDALERGTIAGAGIDVYDEEPLPKDHPFRRLERLVMTPHIGYGTEETFRVFYPQTLECVEAWLQGAPVRVISG